VVHGIRSRVAESEVAGPASSSPVQVTAIETVRRLPTMRAVFAQAKIINIVDGACEMRTVQGSAVLNAGSTIAIGANQWNQLIPKPAVRMWTVCADEALWRRKMGWFLPVKQRVRPGVHPEDWDGTPLVFHLGKARLSALEPIWRQLSLLPDYRLPLELVTARTIELLAQWVGAVLPAFLAPDARTEEFMDGWRPITGRLTDPAMVGQIWKAAGLLRARLAEPWTVESLACEVALSCTHLTRLFVRHAGAPPMRYLTEIRLTEFTRLVEETDMTLARAAKSVGWNDPRVASEWFRRRFGITPSRYRAAT
jgi:AraC-like DNA-binding protein